ncbi:zinc finger protein, putative [Pediculus humanus corporis]|uniref:Zinc finger protein, putative n=1 Tax=Pediculus humanus subsp. corporis TaxID=121224 RepID=E0VCK7_PEDHC|nr:zinc finger protein, putative [Pediculus humanus corporis]EEB11113.1 zinc finger protein, putative [Pediculus humanus corporis]
MHKSAMQMHARDLHRSEMKPHQCQQCLKSFSSNHQLVQHIRVHTGEKPYKCSYCDRRFKQLSHVQQHTRLHTGERPYKCHLPEWGRAFIQLSNLQQHLRNHDAQVERAKNRPFHCNICGKGFATESSLRTHTSKVPKRRTANHPCPICGKHYVNEGSLRKHMTSHPETSQLSSSLRMWPCSVCQAVFTNESGLLSHMEHMRMDPKHQFAAQYVLSRAAAERRERESLIAAAVAASNAGNFGIGGGQPVNSLCPSPAPSDSSSIEHLSSTGSETGAIANNNNNNKLDLTHISPNMNAVRPSTPPPVEYNNIPNRMAALNAAIAQAQNMQTDSEQPVNQNKDFMNNQDKYNVETNGLQMTPSNHNNNEIHPPSADIKPDVFNKDMVTPRNDMTPTHAQQLAVNAMRANLENMRNIESLTGIRPGYLENSLGGQQQQNDSVFRIQQQAAEALLRSQAEAALRLAVSQAAAAVTSERNQNNMHNQLSPDLTEALRLQEQRLEQALRLHGDPRVLGFSLNNTNSNAPNQNMNANNNGNNMNNTYVPYQKKKANQNLNAFGFFYKNSFDCQKFK